MSPVDLSLKEWVILALVCEAPTHGFAIAKQLEPASDLGRILTVHRPLVYRALDRLLGADLIQESATEPGDAGPRRTVVTATRRGVSALDGWFASPVDHVRDLRIEFLVKLRLTERVDRDPTALVDAQRAELAATLAKLVGGDDQDVVDKWRRHNARAAQAFLDGLS